LEIKRIAVIGAGAMGTGIAYQAARFGIEVHLNDREEKYINDGISKIKGFVKDGVNRGKLDLKEAKAILDLIHKAPDLEACVKDADLIIEAVYEDMKVKQELFDKIEAAARPDAIFATNTSSLSVTEMAASTKRPAKFVGIHFFNPVYTMKLVEIVVGKETSEETIKIATKFAQKLDKTCVRCKDSAGFIVNRILGALMGEAFKIYQEGLATAEDIDTAMQLGANHPVGPLTLADYVGLDIAKAVAETLHQAFGDCYTTPKVLVDMVESGKLGMKSGEGFHKYTK
jgi:3-hydroxybutyryl-CoA dehydrogenase